jgi:hypothetical protein
MTFEIHRSYIERLPFDYMKSVEDFRQALLAHRFTGDAAPTAPEAVARAIRRVQTENQPDDFVADVKIIEDVVAPNLAERKLVLLSKIRADETKALVAIIAPARERMLMLDIGVIGNTKLEDMTEDQKALIEKRMDIVAKKTVVARYFLNLEIEIEDLTETTIDAWSFRPFDG